MSEDIDKKGFVYPEEDEKAFAALRKEYLRLQFLGDDPRGAGEDARREFEEKCSAFAERYATFEKTLSRGEPRFDESEDETPEDPSVIVPEEMEGKPVAIVRIILEYGAKLTQLALPASLRVFTLDDRGGDHDTDGISVSPDNPVFLATESDDALVDQENQALLFGRADCVFPADIRVVACANLQPRFLEALVDATDVSSYLEEEVSPEALSIDKVMLIGSFQDDKDYNDDRVVIEKTQEGLSVRIEEHDWWTACQGMSKIDRIRVEDSAENQKYFALICQEALAMSLRNSEYDYWDDYDTNYSFHVFRGREYVRAKFCSVKLLALMKHFAPLMEKWYRFRYRDRLPAIDLSKLQWTADSASANPNPRFYFCYAQGEKKYEFKVFEIPANQYQSAWTKVECYLTEGLHTEEADEELFPEFKEDTFDFIARLEEYAEALTDEDEGDILIRSRGRDIHLSRLPRHILSLLDYISPYPFPLPEDAILEDKDSEFLVLSGKDEVPDHAYQGSQKIKRLKLLSSVDGSKAKIGEEAFKDSSLEYVLLRPRFFAYVGTGQINPVIGKDAFKGTKNLHCYLYDGDLYVGELPGDHGYSLRIAKNVAPKGAIVREFNNAPSYESTKDFVFATTPQGYPYYVILAKVKRCDGNTLTIPTHFGKKRVGGILPRALAACYRVEELIVNDRKLIEGKDILYGCDRLATIRIDKNLSCIVESEATKEEEKKEKGADFSSFEIDDNDLPF